jgi:ATP-dependent protease ClpP protease subunit
MNAITKDWQTPITVYVSSGSNAESRLSAVEAIQLSSLISCLRSPVHTIALGLVHGFEPMLLAAGRRGHRYLLPHALVCIGPLNIEHLQVPNGPAGLNNHSPSLRETAKQLLTRQIEELCAGFGVKPELWKYPRVLTPSEAIEIGLADQVVPTLAPQHKFAHELQHTPAHSQR